MIGVDLSSIATDLQSGEWKGATILAGSCCEALLLYGLQVFGMKAPGAIGKAVDEIDWPVRSPNPSVLTDKSWDLFSYTEFAHKAALISNRTRVELGPTRDFRNLIHPAKAVRENIGCDRGTAFVAARALEHVISDLKKNLDTCGGGS